MFNKKKEKARSMFYSGCNLTEIKEAIKLPEFITNIIISEIVDENIEF